MGITGLLLLVLVNLLARCNAATPSHYSGPFNRSSFPADFVFGAASAAYQIEGAANEGGKGPSIWDTFTHKQPEKIWDRSNGDVAIDFYHRYKEDIHLLKELGMDAFRFSISWSRVLPRGKISGGVNQEGVKFYNDVINELVAKGLKPFVTILHWDVPQALEDEYGGFLHPNIVNDFQDFVDLCFKEFGDRVKHWITMNEPLSFSMFAYAKGTFAPGRCSNYMGNCTHGNSATEPYIVAHHLLLGHAVAVKLYREKYKMSQKGEIGITLVTHWFLPKIKTPLGLKAPYRALDFMLGWFLHPITYGDYPPSMRAFVRNRLPRFTAEQSKLLKGSIDFLGINYYTTNYASPMLSANKVNLSYVTDNHVDLSTEKDGVPVGHPVCIDGLMQTCILENSTVVPPSYLIVEGTSMVPLATALGWLFICPEGLRDLMLYIKTKYNNPPVYITENGMAEMNNSTLPVKEALNDEMRIKYYEGHLWYLQKAIKEGANVKGHFVWSFLDDYEWDAGFTVRFGLTYVDYKDGLKRHFKLSAYWFKKFLQK